MRVTVFAPHPDDELIGCGGSVLNWVRAGAEVSVVYLTSGDAPVDGKSRDELAALREGEATAGAKLLNVTELSFLREPDGCLTDGPQVIAKLVGQLRHRRPNLVYVPHALDDHPDHMATHRLLKRAVNDAAGPWWVEAGLEPWRVETTLAYEVWTPIPRPTYLEDTTDAIDEQLEALAQHRSQLSQVPYDSFVRGLGAYRGARLGHGRYAEAFEVLGIQHLPGRAP
ncbi:PIG-L deacetylase family protein [Amycolatopsis sp. NPDC101161]|uniref:PIG-L deacetylase family protein n=1 Tax=Amycolatopsis sp. NPDC101161 TaxID=3363940 RepID=UPI0038008A0A